MTKKLEYVPGNVLIDLYRQNKFGPLLVKFEAVIVAFGDIFYSNIGNDEQSRIDDMAAAILYIFSQTDFSIPVAHVNALISMNHLIANFFACSSYKTTDGLLKNIKLQKNNLYKILCMYSCRNEPIFDPNTFFDLNPDLATRWWLICMTATAGTTSKLLASNLKQHYSIDFNKLQLPDSRVIPTYFDCSYLTFEGVDRPLKEILNKQSRSFLPEYKHSSALRRDGIAIVSGRWNKTSAVYKSSFPQLEALSKKYRLTLVHLGEMNDSVDTSIFRKVISVGDTSKELSLKALRDLDSKMAYFPDIGMSNESVAMSNIKIAPIMVCGYGHPASTFGSLVDYFIGGQDTERVDLAAKNYSEKLVLVPGLGAHPVFPNQVRARKPKDGLIINCCWTCTKINYQMLCNLRKIVDRVKKPVKIQLFSSWTIGRYNSMLPFVNDVGELFGDEFAIYPERPYPEYLNILEQGDITLDSWPFGGYNTVVDSFFMGCPVVAIEGVRFYNRASSALLRRVGLDNLIAHSEEEYVAKAAELLANPEALAAAREKLASIEVLKAKLCDNGEEDYFVKAIDFIMNNHEKIKDSPGPFLIEA